MMMRNGLSKSPIHAFWTGLGMNPTDIVMMTLYSLGLSNIFQIHWVQIVLYIAGIFLLIKLGVGCLKKTNVDLSSDGNSNHSAFDSFKDGVKVSIIPSSLITWCALYGSFLSVQPNFIIACLGILAGFTLSNFAYMTITFVIRKVANNLILKYVNIFGALFLFGFACYFIYQLFQLLL